MRIYGASDDLVEIECTPMRTDFDELGCFDEDVRLTLGDDIHGGIVIVMSYGPDDLDDGCWQARIAPIAEDVTCPWQVRVTCLGYSAVVTIDCPADVKMRAEWRKRGENKSKWAVKGPHWEGR